MLNGITGAGAVCCQYSPRNGNIAYGNANNTKPINVGGIQVNVPRNTRGLLGQIGEALDQAIHGGDSLSVQRLIDNAARSYLGSGSGGANVIPFPMVNPFKPVIATRAPITGLTRFPKRFTYEVADNASEPDDEQSSLNGLGAFDDELGPPPPVPVLRSSSSGTVQIGGGTLQSIIRGIQGTLPATIQAFRASPANIYPNTYNPYASSAGGPYPGSTGNAAENVGAGVGRAADTLGGTLSRFVTEHPYMVIGGGAALALLFMNPPRRR